MQENLVAKCQSLNAEGITCYHWCGGYRGKCYGVPLSACVHQCSCMQCTHDKLEPVIWGGSDCQPHMFKQAASQQAEGQMAPTPGFVQLLKILKFPIQCCGHCESKSTLTCQTGQTCISALVQLFVWLACPLLATRRLLTASTVQLPACKSTAAAWQGVQALSYSSCRAIFTCLRHAGQHGCWRT